AIGIKTRWKFAVVIRSGDRGNKSSAALNSLFLNVLMEIFMNLKKKQELWYIKRFAVLKHGDSPSTTCYALKEIGPMEYL
ncbi:hypothetical protein, partial [Candidatus Thiosymbion oneisti]|uniref:hypothetical protein n=1 Tax=Candidatus Thiosymbion oneisti TaxID=589554 RepID=UPI001C403C06